MSAVEHSKHRRGCDCLNQTGELGDGVNPGRCDHCDDPYKRALCAYLADFGCAYYTGAGTTREKITEPCIVLRKDCANVGCTYSSRWSCPGGNPINDRPMLRYAGCDLIGANAGPRCPDCQNMRCIEGTITNLTRPDAITAEEWCLGDIDGATELRFQLVYNGAEVTTERDVEAYPGSCMWSGFAINVANGDELFRMPIYLDLIDGQFRLRLYFPDVFSLSGCLPPSSTADLLGFYRVDIYLPYSSCDGFIDLDYDAASPPADHPSALYTAPVSAGFTMSIRDWSLQNGCTPIASINMAACSWAEDPCVGPDTCDQSQEASGSYDEFSDSTDTCYTKWRMTITSPTTATLNLETREGFFAHYVCNSFNCYERSNFSMQPGAATEANPGGDYSPEVIGLPLCICVSPLNYFPDGGCVNSGTEACCDSGGPFLNVTITTFNCDGDIVHDRVSWPFSRGTPLPCGVVKPVADGDECLYFTALIPIEDDCADWGGDIFVVMMCSAISVFAGPNPCGAPEPIGAGGQYRYSFVYYCLNVDTDCWEEQGSFCQEYECTCLGPNPPEATFTKECCCPTCAGCAYSTDDLTATVTFTPPCPGGCSGGSVTLVWNGTNAWIATSPICGDTIGFWCSELTPDTFAFFTDGLASVETPVTGTCDPFEFTIDNVPFTDADPGCLATVVITQP